MFITFLIYGIIHRIRTQALAKKRRPKKVLIEDQFSSIIKTNAQELLRPSSVLIILQKNDKTGAIFQASALSPIQSLGIDGLECFGAEHQQSKNKTFGQQNNK